MKKLIAFVLIAMQATLVSVKIAGATDASWLYVFAPSLLAVGVSLHFLTVAAIAMATVKRLADQGMFTESLADIAEKVEHHTVVNTDFAASVTGTLAALDKRIAELEKREKIH